MKYLKQLLESIVTLAKELKELKQNYTTISGDHLATRNYIDAMGVTISGMGTPINDCRDEGVVISKEKAVQLIKIDGYGNIVREYTRKSKLSKEENELYQKFKVVVIKDF